jgi:hypothetical protein
VSREDRDTDKNQRIAELEAGLSDPVVVRAVARRMWTSAGNKSVDWEDLSKASRRYRVLLAEVALDEIRHQLGVADGDPDP